MKNNLPKVDDCADDDRDARVKALYYTMRSLEVGARELYMRRICAPFIECTDA